MRGQAAIRQMFLEERFRLNRRLERLEAVMLDSLMDTGFGNLDGKGTCSLSPTVTLAPSGQPGDSYTCSFIETISGNVGEDHQNTATAVASDNDGNSDTESASADVTITNLDPVIDVTKMTGSETVPPSGGYVEFTVTVTNNSGMQVSLDYWTDIILWNGKPYGKNPIFGPKHGTLPPDKTKRGHIAHRVPYSAPLETYACCGRIGSHPDTIWDEDCFEFTVVEPSGLGIEGKPWEVLESSF